MSPRPLIFQAVISLVKGSAAAQPGSSSSFMPCDVVSGLSVTTQVLLRSVVASSHCPIMSFFRVEASCDRAGDASADSTDNATMVAQGRPADIQRPFTGVSGTGGSGALPANQFFRLSTTSWSMALRVTTEAEPICGSSTTFCILFNLRGTFG